MPHHHSSNEVADAVLASGLILAPAWSPPLAEINEFLLTISLVLGVVIGLVRLWFIISDRK